MAKKISDHMERLLVRLAHNQWTKLRREHNRIFMLYGSGPDWDQYKKTHAEEFRDIEYYQQYCIERIHLIDELGLRGNITAYNGVSARVS